MGSVLFIEHFNQKRMLLSHSWRDRKKHCSSTPRLELTEENTAVWRAVRKSLSDSKKTKWRYTVWTCTVNITKSPEKVWHSAFWRSTHFYWMVFKEKVYETNVLDKYANVCIWFLSFLFSLRHSRHLFWEKPLIFTLFCLQMVGAVHRKDCGRRLDASRFSHCCQRHLRWNACVILQNV